MINLKDSYTLTEAKNEIDSVMKKYGEECEVNFIDYAADLIDSYKVRSIRDRKHVCEIIRRTGKTKRSARSLSAEWMVHNISYYLGIRKASAKDACLDFGEDPRLYVRLFTSIFHIFNIR